MTATAKTLVDAVLAGPTAEVRRFLDRGGDPNTVYPCEDCDSELRHEVVGHPRGWAPLLVLAAWTGRTGMVEALLELGAWVDMPSYSWTIRT